MKNVKEILRDADPLRHGVPCDDRERDRVRRTVVAAASGVVTKPGSSSRFPLAAVAVVALIVVGILAVGARTGPRGSATVYAAVRFEVRLAEDRAAAGLREARVAGADRVVYLHEEIVVTNADIERSAVAQGSSPARFSVGVRFNAAGAEKMRQATANHVGRVMAILIDGEVVAAPVLRSAISDSALITGDFSQAEAERIVNGVGVRER
jgi:hypothetical protein